MIPRVVAGWKRSGNKVATSGMAFLSALVLLVVLLTLGAVPAQATVDEQAARVKVPPTFESLRSNPDRPEVVGDPMPSPPGPILSSNEVSCCSAR